MQGVALHLFGVEADGALFALIAPDAIGNQMDGRFIGVRIVVRGPPDVLPDLATDIGMMLRSFAPIDIEE